MIKILLRNIIRFIVLVLIQVLVLNNIQISGYINPYFYILFILLLPFEIQGWLLLILAFLLGFSIDIFSNTAGLHASATVFMAFLRPVVLHSIAPRDGYEVGTFPRLSQYGFLWFFKYSVIMVFIHHLFYFTTEAFGFSNYLETLLRASMSAVFSLILIVLSQYIIFKE